jgi:phenylpropionate dioxygenase-like ring-hydroxylating dioxygenase large terminal subunit
MSSRSELRIFGKALPPMAASDPRPDWEQADPGWIRGALALSQNLPGGGWYVLDASRSFGDAPRRMFLRGKPLVVWRAGSQLMAASDICPHLGASLSEGRVCDGQLVCPWHGLRLGPGPQRGWKPLTVYDDGLLFWVRSGDGSEPLSERPYLPPRPAAASALEAVIRMEVACEPADIVQNRLDPWHGAHYHPHSFGRLRVIEQNDAAITVRVAFKVLGPFAVEVDARFHCPDPRSIVMTIVGGEGLGSVVETHATPLGPGQSAMIELTMASSERLAFALARRAHRALRPLVQWAALRLWREDARYAERLYELRRSPRARLAQEAEHGGDRRAVAGAASAHAEKLES